MMDLNWELINTNRFLSNSQLINANLQVEVISSSSKDQPDWCHIHIRDRKLIVNKETMKRAKALVLNQNK